MPEETECDVSYISVTFSDSPFTNLPSPPTNKQWLSPAPTFSRSCMCFSEMVVEHGSHDRRVPIASPSSSHRSVCSLSAVATQTSSSTCEQQFLSLLIVYGRR